MNQQKRGPDLHPGKSARTTVLAILSCAILIFCSPLTSPLAAQESTAEEEETPVESTIGAKTEEQQEQGRGQREQAEHQVSFCGTARRDGSAVR